MFNPNFDYDYEIGETIPGTEKNMDDYSSFLSYGTELITGEEVVIKQIYLYGLDRKKQIELENMFMEEIRIMRNLTKLGCTAKIKSYFMMDDELVFAMEKVNGKPVSDFIYNDNYTLLERVQLAKHIADAYTAIHRLGIIHRDLSDQNIFVDIEGNVKVIDFGLSFQRVGVRFRAGTDIFPPPESASLDYKPTFQYDIFSFGVLLYLLIYQKRPFEKGEVLQNKGVVLDFPNEPNVPIGLQEMMTNCMQYDPSDRPRSMKGIYYNLEKMEGMLL